MEISQYGFPLTTLSYGHFRTLPHISNTSCFFFLNCNISVWSLRVVLYTSCKVFNWFVIYKLLILLLRLPLKSIAPTHIRSTSTVCLSPLCNTFSNIVQQKLISTAFRASVLSGGLSVNAEVHLTWKTIFTVCCFCCYYYKLAMNYLYFLIIEHAVSCVTVSLT